MNDVDENVFVRRVERHQIQERINRLEYLFVVIFHENCLVKLTEKVSTVLFHESDVEQSTRFVFVGQIELRNIFRQFDLV